MTRDAQFGPQALVEPTDAAIKGTYNSACEPCPMCERVGRQHCESVGEEDEMELIAALTEALKECADELAAWVEGHYQLMLNYPSEARRFERDMGPVRRARALLALSTEPAKAEEENSFLITEEKEEEER